MAWSISKSKSKFCLFILSVVICSTARYGGQSSAFTANTQKLQQQQQQRSISSISRSATTTTTTTTTTSSETTTMASSSPPPSSDIDAIREQAALYIKNKQLSQALEAYDTILFLLPKSSFDVIKDVSFQRAFCLSQMGYVDEAIHGFQTITTMNNKHDDTTTTTKTQNQNQQKKRRPSNTEINLANILLEGRGKKSSALEIYQRCGTESPMVILSGICLDSLGRHQEARECYQHALLLKGGDSDYEAMIHLCINDFRRLNTEDESDNISTDDSIEDVKKNMEHMLEKVERSQHSSHIATSWKYIQQQQQQQQIWSSPSVHYFTYDMMQMAMQHADLEDGLVLEFGVYYGKTIRMMAEYFPKDTTTIHGFDTFEGLPSDWFNNKKGSYSTQGTIPSAPDNVKFYKGLFSETLPVFLKEQPTTDRRPIRLMNIDCDMYESTKDVFDLVGSRVVPGTIIVFDEYIGNPNWKKDEYKAFQEATIKYGWNYEYIGISMVSQQAIVKII